MTLAPADVQELIGHGREAWTPREGETWEAFVRRKAPSEPAFWQPMDRADFRRALAAALSRSERRETVRAWIVPMWKANNEDEEPRDDEWRAATIVAAETDDALLMDIDSGDGASWAQVSLTLVKGAFVTLSRHFAPAVKAEHFGRFAVVDTQLREIVEEVTLGERVALTAAPTRMVPAFAMHYEPAFDLASVPPEVADVAKRIAAKLSFEPDDDARSLITALSK